jgi:NAD(P)-dependent dehydrogenase (short-subunit alcohol dehydrogenase family)
MRAVVMGGTSGIGLAAAQELTAAGIDVTVTGRDPARLTAAAASVAGAERLDGTDFAAVSSFYADFGPFEHLILAFSPGAVGLGPVRESTAADVETAFRGKLFAYLHAIRSAEVTATITLISAASGHAPNPGTVVLSAVNGAIERIVGPLAAELAPIRVNAVSPGVVDTPWWSFVPEAGREAQFAEWTQSTPVGRWAMPTDVARAIVYLVSAPMVTGTIMPVDGGLTLA